MCVAGTEALFADLGHFSVRSIQVSMSAITYPTLMITYSGQASFLRLHQNQVSNTFYDAIPGQFSISILLHVTSYMLYYY